MMTYERRLSALARQLGCPVHGALLSCLVCDVPEPLATMLDRLISAMVARVGVEGLRAIVLRVPRPPGQRPCERCGGPRQCGACQVRYAQAVFGHIGLTAAEQAMLDALLAACRVQDSKR